MRWRLVNGERRVQVIDFRSDLLPELVRLVGRQMALVPPGWAPTPEAVAAVLAGAAPWDIHYPEAVLRPPVTERLRPRRVAPRRGGRVVTSGP
jgi:hypothetical protein